MLESATTLQAIDGSRLPQGASKRDKLVDELNASFSTQFSLWNGETGELIHAAENQPVGDELALSELIRAVASFSEPQFIGEADGLLTLALPVDANYVATAVFAVEAAGADTPFTEAARMFGAAPDSVRRWAGHQPRWTAHALLSLAKALQEKWAAQDDADRQRKEIELVSRNLAATYEEISLIYSVTQNLRISSTEEELGQMAAEWLLECVPAEACALLYLPTAEAQDETSKGRRRSILISAGNCPISEAEFARLIKSLKLDRTSKPFVANANVTQSEAWDFPEIRQLIAVPLSEGEKLFGWLAAFNHVSDEEFGTVEAKLLNSLGALLGIHGSNRELYREQAEFVANVVRALVSAIDAKDPYTSGHSDRVARFAVRIALEMRCNPKLVNTLYMAGLLHDVGKIGINDSVLRKAGRLTDAEFDHIKMHPEMGHKILAELKQLADVLPAVLHHHEQWNGKGYPAKLKGEEIPLIARIMAVADAYDAMTSDRPYRNGMPDEKVDEIFRNDAGTYWDPKIVEAFFRVRDDIKEIAERKRAELVDSFSQQLI